MLPLEQGRDWVSFACFASPLESVISDAVNALSPVGTATGLPSLTLPSQPYRSEAMTAVVWAPKQDPESAVFMAGFSDGWATLVHILATRFGHATAKVRLSSPMAEWPIAELVVYENGHERRLIRAMRDDPRWKFFAQGTAMDFEEASAYSSRRVRDRFTPDMLYRYLAALGWSPCDDTFWTTEQTAFEVCSTTPNKPK